MAARLRPLLFNLLPNLRPRPLAVRSPWPSRLASSTFPRQAQQAARTQSPILSLLRTSFSRPSFPPPIGTRAFFSGARSGAYYAPRQGGSRAGPRGGPSSSSAFKDFRRRFERLPGDYIVWAIISANLGVFLAWQYGEQLYARFRDASWLRFLNRNFTTSWRNFKEGRVWCVLTCCFSQSGSTHILMNMLSLYFLAPAVIAVTGNVAFLGLYLGGGILSSVFSLVMNNFVERRPNPNYSSHGASGAVYALLSFYAACFPRSTFLLFFVVPVPAWSLVSGLFAWDTYSTFNRAGGKTDSAGHVGGVAAGLLWFARFSGRF